MTVELAPLLGIGTPIVVAILSGLGYVVIRLTTHGNRIDALNEEIERERQSNQQLREELKQDFQRVYDGLDGLKVAVEQLKGQITELYNRHPNPHSK